MAVDIVETLKKKYPSTHRHSNSKWSKLCGSSIVDFQEWRVLENILFVCFLLLGMYAFAGMSSNAINLKAWNNVESPSDFQLTHIEISIIITAQAILLVGVICGILFLFLLRNWLGFLLTLILLTVSALIFIALIIYLAYLIFSDHGLKQKMYSTIFHHMNRQKYKFYIEAIQWRYQCCGIRGFQDWRGFRQFQLAPHLPGSCSKSGLNGLQYLNSGLDGLQKNYMTLGLTHNLHGCFRHLSSGYRKILVAALVEGFIVLILIIASIIILCILFWLWYVLAHRTCQPASEGREQEGDRESDIVPGTPMKSYVSSSQGLFYAP